VSICGNKIRKEILYNECKENRHILSWLFACLLVSYLTTLSVSRPYGVEYRLIDECEAAGGMRFSVV
jgi:hypothetical protein